MSIIYHIAKKDQWSNSQAAGEYTVDSLRIEGYIHCSTRDQVVATANRLFAGQRDLILLAIDEQPISAPIRYENLEGGDMLFPHIYGAIPLSAVARTYEFRPDERGQFEFPKD